ncbi:MAG: hypothetical protein ACOCWC_00790 [Bacteroidota bacterium]
MALFRKFFNKEQDQSITVSSNNEFGRYLACNKPYTLNKKYNKAVELFDAEDYLGSFNKLLDFLFDPSQQNIDRTFNRDILEFSLLQGSRKISGRVDNDEFYVSASLGKYEVLNPALFRYLLLRNHNLKYCCFAISNNEIIVKAAADIKTSTPEKLFFTLKEVALTSDIDSDSLKRDFSFLVQVGKYTVNPLPDKKKGVKIKYLKKWISDTLHQVNNMNADSEAIFVSYYLLSTLYRIDFLLTPEGELKTLISDSLKLFNQKNLSSTEKFDMVKSSLLEVLSFSDTQFSDSFCKYKYTFGIVEATSHKIVYEFILKHFDEISKLLARSSQNQILCMYEYIIGYVLYYFGVYPPTKQLMLLIYRVLYPEFFYEVAELPKLYDAESETFKVDIIEKEISNIVLQGRKEYPRLGVVAANISYKNLRSFSKSLLNEITFLNYSQPEI